MEVLVRLPAVFATESFGAQRGRGMGGRWVTEVGHLEALRLAELHSPSPGPEIRTPGESHGFVGCGSKFKS